MLVHCLQDTGEHQQELDVLMRRLARIQKVLAVVCGQGPVVMLTGTVDSCERFLMKQSAHAMAACNFL